VHKNDVSSNAKVLLLNMMLAILLDSYSGVKSQTSSMTTLNTQISEMLRRRASAALEDACLALGAGSTSSFKAKEDGKTLVLLEMYVLLKKVVTQSETLPERTGSTNALCQHPLAAFKGSCGSNRLSQISWQWNSLIHKLSPIISNLRLTYLA